MRSIIDGVVLSEILAVVPAFESRFDDEVGQYLQSADSTAKLKQVMGYDTHRLAQEGVTVSDLAAFGIEQLVAGGGLELMDVGALIVVTQTPDFALPATSAYLHGRLGLAERVHCVDINDGCNGYVKGLHAAASLFKVSDVDCVLLITGDVLSHRVARSDRNSFPLIGDAVAISVVRRSAGSERLHFDLRNDGKGFDRIIIPAGGARRPASTDAAKAAIDEDGNSRSPMDLVMQGRDVFTFTQTVVPQFIDQFLEWIGEPIGNFDRLYLHQANAFIIDRLRKRFRLGADVVPDEVIRRYGNSSSATIPMAIAADFHSKPGASVLCGFGVGLSWGAVSLNLGSVQSAKIIDFGAASQ